MKILDIPQAEFNEPLILPLVTNLNKSKTEYMYLLTLYKITIFQNRHSEPPMNVKSTSNITLKQEKENLH